jgi:hypothetical protein
MAPHHRIADGVIELIERQRLWRFLEEGAVQILGGIAAGPTNHDALAVLFPLEHGAWTDAEPSADLTGH